jgi:hypothetical protein
MCCPLVSEKQIQMLTILSITHYKRLVDGEDKGPGTDVDDPNIVSSVLVQILEISW